jgi:sensor histidine kinase YesM
MVHFSSKSLASVSVWRGLLWVLLFNTAIALVVTLVFHGSFLPSLAISQIYGLSIYGGFVVFERFAEIRLATFWIPLVAGTLLGLALQVALWALIQSASLHELWTAVAASHERLGRNVLIALFFSVIILYFFITRSRAMQFDRALQEVRVRSLEHEKRLVETRLHLLQAQIEPHFLFNTLSNVLGLLDADPTLGRQMLASLTRYLRSALKRSREHEGTLQQEIDLIRDYLDIFKVRMGQRLRYAIDVPDDCRGQRFAPMLLQPLVENAIKHGLEPAADGGTIRIAATRRAGVLHVEVTDDGLGLRHEAGSGFGIANIRERLRALYGEAARLRIEAALPTGVNAVIEVPDAAG